MGTGGIGLSDRRIRNVEGRMGMGDRIGTGERMGGMAGMGKTVEMEE